jgi:hypothetical protein
MVYKKSLLEKPASGYWREFVENENWQCTRVAQMALDNFVKEFKNYPKNVRSKWVHALVDKEVRGLNSFKIRHPLFREIVLPILLEDYDNNVANSAKNLLYFYYLIHGGNLCADIIKDYSLDQYTLINRAIMQDPSDKSLRLQRIKLFIDLLEYELHELPHGVLFGHGFASIDECSLLLKHVDNISVWIEEEGLTHSYNDLITTAKVHINGYQDFLKNLDKYKSYEHYISVHGIEE